MDSGLRHPCVERVIGRLEREHQQRGDERERRRGEVAGHGDLLLDQQHPDRARRPRPRGGQAVRGGPRRSSAGHEPGRRGQPFHHSAAGGAVEEGGELLGIGEAVEHPAELRPRARQGDELAVGLAETRFHLAATELVVGRRRVDHELLEHGRTRLGRVGEDVEPQRAVRSGNPRQIAEAAGVPIDCSDKVVAPGFINTHSHSFGGFDQKMMAHDGTTTILDTESGVADADLFEAHTIERMLGRPEFEPFRESPRLETRVASFQGIRPPACRLPLLNRELRDGSFVRERADAAAD